MNDINKNGYAFKFAITGNQYALSPALLGRDNPYTLNVKLVDKDGKPVLGVQYKITSTNDGAHLVSLDGMGRTYTSSEAGEDFYIEGLPATTAADLNKMQYAFSVDCETEGESETVIGRYPLRMGRLLRWGRPGISVKTNPDKAVFSTKTERVAKESTAGANWNWGEKIDQCKIKLGTSIEGSGTTSPTSNNDGSFTAAPEIDLSKFSNVSTTTLQFEGGLSDDQFTAVLPSTENDVELYYFQSVAFTKPSVIVGVPAEVTCKLMGLDKKPRANVDVEWTTNFGTLDPAASKTDAQGVAKTKCTANDAGTATVTVLSKAHRTIRGTSAAVPVGPLVIVEPVASATQYIVGHSSAIQFAVTLKAGGQPVSGLTVEWFIDNTAKGTSTSNDSGKAVRELTFTAGSNVKQVVKAKVSSTQVQTTFDVDVYAVEITDPRASATEYVIKHSADVEFSVVLKAGGKPLSGKTIEWTVGGNKTNSTTDSTGKATFKKAFDAAGDVTVSAKDPKSGKTHNFQLKVVAVDITDPKASATEYVIKHSADVEFSVVLKAGGTPLTGKTIEWTVGGNKTDSTTDSTGKATFKKGFTAAGDFTVLAKDPKSGKEHRFTVKAYALTVRATWRADNSVANRYISSPVRYRGLRYILNIQLVYGRGNIIVGVPFTLRAPGHADSGVEVDIEGLDEEVLSTKDGVDFKWGARDSLTRESIKLMVSGESVESWESVHPLGWLAEPSLALITSRESASILWRMITDLGDSSKYRVPNIFGSPRVYVQSFDTDDWHVQASVMIRLTVYGGFSTGGFELKKGEGILVYSYDSEDGYLKFEPKVLFL